MRSTEQLLNTAISELRCIDPHAPVSLDGLSALSAARDCIEELLRDSVDELRANPRTQQSWAAIARALGEASAPAARKRYSTQVDLENEHVEAFWAAVAPHFVWDFLPIGFVHALYVDWLSEAQPNARPLSPRAFTRRIRAVAEHDGAWLYARLRITTQLANQREPLLDRIPEWSPVVTSAATYGLKRASSNA